VQSQEISCKGVQVLTSQRKQFILEVLKKEGQVVAKTLSQQLELSEDTIRRDLRELAKEGLLQGQNNRLAKQRLSLFNLIR
jgi:DeoR/GlpR family transcriptional regulator of sugar metabolism